MIAGKSGLCGKREATIKSYWKPVALCAALSLAMIASRAGAQTSAAATDDGALAARSAALLPADKARAQSLFSTSFGLWQSGDFAAAEIGFRQGLDIDPTNALANFYYGDCLVRRKNKAEARIYLARAAAFGAATAEGLKAQAELQALSVAPTSVADMDAPEIASALQGAWSIREICSYGSGMSKLVVGPVDADSGTFSATIGGCRFESGQVQGAKVRFSCVRMGNHISYSGALKSPTEMGGDYIQDSGQCSWTGTKP